MKRKTFGRSSFSDRQLSAVSNRSYALLWSGYWAAAAQSLWFDALWLWWSRSLEQDTSIKPTSESAEMRMIDFFMMLNCLFNNDSAQLALKDVLEQRNSLKLRSWRVAALTHSASVLLREFWP